jgi:hypothetical protein
MKNHLTIFKVIWMFNALVTAAAALMYGWMFVGGGSGPHNDAQWKWAFAFAAIALWGSKNLMAQNRKRFAWLLLASLAIPCILLVVFIIVLLTGDLHWQ